MGTPIREIVRTPDFQYAMLYYPEIVARLRRLNRVFAPEITNEDPREPFIQLERAFSLMAHYNNVLLDMVANESFISTARMPNSVKELLKLVNYKMLPASPAMVDIVAELVRTYTAATTLLDANRKVATKRTAANPEIVFENLADVEITSRTDQVTYVYAAQSIATMTCKLSSVYPDIIEWTAGMPFLAAHLNCTVSISQSTLGNLCEELVVIEYLEWDAGIPGYRKIRVADASFIEESGVVCDVYNTSANIAGNLNAGIVTDPFALDPILNDRLYIGHADVMFDRLDVDVDAATVLGCQFIWEFFDTSDTVYHPDVVTVVGSSMYFTLDSLLGTVDVTGAIVEVTYVTTGVKARGRTTLSAGHNRITVLTSFGQATPSTNSTDYTVSCRWRPLDIITDGSLFGSSSMGKDGAITFNLPQTLDDRWEQFTLHDYVAVGDKVGYFIRARCTSPGAPGPSGPVLKQLDIDNGKQYVMYDATQGSSAADDPLGSSDGTADQEFTLTKSPYVYGSIRVWVDEGSGLVEWSSTTSWRRSYAFDRHFMIDMLTDGTAKIIFGDGIHGKIPIAGVNNVVAAYRIEADEDGNVGPSTITVNRDGVSVFRNVNNPRSARYWQEADWASMEALERVKESGPLMLRTMFRAVTARDCEILTTRYAMTSGTRPVERAQAYEEAFGPKTVQIVVVGRGGVALDAASKTVIEGYFNGDDTYDGVLVMNHEATITNYTPRSIAVSCIVTATSVVSSVAIRSMLIRLLSPTALEADGKTYVWRFGQTVPVTRIASEIYQLSPGNVYNVTFTVPASDVLLGANELPMYDDAGSTVTVVEPSF